MRELELKSLAHKRRCPSLDQSQVFILATCQAILAIFHRTWLALRAINVPQRSRAPRGPSAIRVQRLRNGIHGILPTVVLKHGSATSRGLSNIASYLPLDRRVLCRTKNKSSLQFHRCILCNNKVYPFLGLLQVCFVLLFDLDLVRSPPLGLCPGLGAGLQGLQGLAGAKRKRVATLRFQPLPSATSRTPR